MIKFNETYNIATRGLTSAFPRWSLAYGDPNSSTNKLLNPFANSLEYMSVILPLLHDDSMLVRVDPDRHPYKRWVINQEDVVGFDPAFESADIFLENIDAITGIISGVSIPIPKIESFQDLYGPQLQTGWYVSGTIEHGISGQITAIRFGGPNLLAVNFSGTTVSGDPGTIETIVLPDRWKPNLTNSTELVVTQTPDPNYITVRLQFNPIEARQRFLLDHQLRDKSYKITVIDNIATILSGSTTILTSGFTFIDTSEYLVRDVYLADIDNDGLVDERELELINQEFGKKQSDYSVADWNNKYSKYDINKNGIIDEEDKIIANAYRKTMSRNVSAIEFESAGSYTVEYVSTADSKAAITAIANISRIPGGEQIEYFRNTSYGYLPTEWPSGFVDYCYDPHKDVFYYLDNNSKSLWGYQRDIFQNAYDRVKLLLPVTNGLDLRGIEYSGYRIYILAIVNGQPKIIVMRTDQDNPEDHVFLTDIHSGNRISGDVDIIVRDLSGLTNDVRGLTMISDSKLVTFDGPDIKIMLPLYDYYFQDKNEENKNVLHFREKYEDLDLSPSGEVIQVFQNIFNPFDQHAQDKGLVRLPGESNQSLKIRALDVFEHFPSRDRRGSLFGMQRELGLPIVDIGQEKIDIMPAGIIADNAETVNIFIDGTEVNIDKVEITPVYNYGKKIHDQVTLKSSGEVVLKFDDIIVQ